MSFEGWVERRRQGVWWPAPTSAKWCCACRMMKMHAVQQAPMSREWPAGVLQYVGVSTKDRLVKRHGLPTAVDAQDTVFDVPDARRASEVHARCRCLKAIRKPSYGPFVAPAASAASATSSVASLARSMETLCKKKKVPSKVGGGADVPLFSELRAYGAIQTCSGSCNRRDSKDW